MFHFIKQVDWKAKGVDLVRWEIHPIQPLDCNVREFIREKEALGWEVVAFTETADGMPAVQVEMDKRIYDAVYGGKYDIQI